MDASIRRRMDYFFSVEWVWVFGLQPKARFNVSIVSYDGYGWCGGFRAFGFPCSEPFNELFPNKSSGKRYYVCTKIG